MLTETKNTSPAAGQSAGTMLPHTKNHEIALFDDMSYTVQGKILSECHTVDLFLLHRDGQHTHFAYPLRDGQAELDQVAW